MGRNSASKLMWAHTHNGTDHVFIYYCQQHNDWDQTNDTVLATAFLPLKTHIETKHGNVEQ